MKLKPDGLSIVFGAVLFAIVIFYINAPKANFFLGALILTFLPGILTVNLAKVESSKTALRYGFLVSIMGLAMFFGYIFISSIYTHGIEYSNVAYFMLLFSPLFIVISSIAGVIGIEIRKALKIDQKG